MFFGKSIIGSNCWFEKCIRFEHRRRNANLPDGALVPEDLVEPHADRGLTGGQRGELNVGRKLLLAVHVMSHGFAVHNDGRVAPGSERVQKLLRIKGLFLLARLQVGVEKPQAVGR